MADTKKYGWNVQIDGVQYLVEYMKGSIFINGGEAFKLRSLERTGTLRKDKQLSYTVPLAGKELNLVISAVSGISLIMDGMDLGTYPDGAGANQKAPAWIVVFYVLYFIENISDELKQEIRNRLATICYGVEQTQSNCGIYSYEETVKDFIHRYKTQKDKSESRKKGMIGELLVHIILELEGKYSTASPFFNMEESSFKKGFDIVLFEEDSKELWITETKSGEIQKKQKNANSAVSGLINTAKKDLKKRLNSNEKNFG